MQSSPSVPVFSALGQTTRLRAFNLLLEAGEDGMLQNEIARGLSVEKNLLSVHLRILEAAGLVASERSGRTKRFRVATEPAHMAARELLGAIEAKKDPKGAAGEP
jgi:DNA-binding transcriptional ArsR family regulator